MFRRLVPIGVLFVAACGPADKGLVPWCSDGVADAGAAPGPALSTTPTFHADIKPIVEAKCVRCHEPGGLAPFPLQTYEHVFTARAAVAEAVSAREMPPWFAAPCCAQYRQDWSLTADEISAMIAWVRAGAPEGDPAAPPSRQVAKVGGLSRVDFTVRMPAAYTPQPPKGSTDDVRCFLADWPLDRAAYVTGINVLPGQRSIVHHLIVAVLEGGDIDVARERDGRDGRPGFPCAGGTGSIKPTAVLGGGLGALEPPEGFGTLVKPGAKVLLNIHYSTAKTGPNPPADQTAVQVKVSDSGRRLKGAVVTNAAWIVGDAMKVRAGDSDALFYFSYRPRVFTRGKRVLVWGAHPHMHEFGSKFLMSIRRADGSSECLLELPKWRFGWEQPYFFAEPKVMGPDDQLYIECHFDNSESRQPIVDGKRVAPRDIAWGGNNQDMCVGFIAFAEE